MTTILIVEDNEMNLDLVTQLLEDEYTIIAASDGAAGVEMATQQRPDLVLMDLSLPKVDGWEAIRLLRQSPETKDIPIIALSAHAAPEDIVRARQAGCDEYVTKPVDEGQLLGHIATLLARKGECDRVA